MHVAAGREAGADQPLGAPALGEVVGGVDRIHGGDALGLDIGNQRVGDVGEDHAGQHVDLVGLDQLAGAGQGGGRDALVVLQDDLEVAPGELPAALLPVELAAAVHVL